MTDLRLLDTLLTEFDETISSELNIDPLGLLVIWSSYGQDIFRRRISSISNDVRNYTLNLFNHAAIRSLIEDDGAALGKGLRSDPAYAGRGKDSIAFKQACLIYLENVFTYAMIEAQDENGVETGVGLFLLPKVTVGKLALAWGWLRKPMIPMAFLFTFQSPFEGVNA
jgi:hypothetical protein